MEEHLTPVQTEIESIAVRARVRYAFGSAERLGIKETEVASGQTFLGRRNRGARISAWRGVLPCRAQLTLGLSEPVPLLFGLLRNAAGGLPLPPPAVTWQISSDLELVSFGDLHPTPRQRQNVGVLRAALAGVPHDPAHPVLVLLERIAKGSDAARLQTDQGAT